MYPNLQNLRSKSPLALALYGLLGTLLIIYILNPVVVTVSGTGEASVTATAATVSFTLSATDSSSPQNAISNVNAKALAMRTYLKSQGVNDNNIAQSEVTAVPVTASNGSNSYQATISMAAKTSQINEVSTLVSGLYSQGAFVVSQPVLSVENQTSLDKQAYDAAIKDAKSHIGRIGMSHFKFIRKLISVVEVTSSPTSTSTVKPDAASAPDALASSNGVFKIVKAVTVTYKLW